MAGLVPATQKRWRSALVRSGAAASFRLAAVSLGGRDKPGHDGHLDAVI